MMWILKYERFTESVLLRLSDNVDYEMVSKIESLVDPPAKILEISCGNGADSIYLKKRGYDITCTDNNRDYVENAEKNGLKSMIHDTSEPFPFDDRSFDLIYSRLGLHYFTEEVLDRIFSELKRMTKKYLVFSVKTVNDIQTGKIILTSDKWREITERYFDVVSFEEKSGMLYDNPSQWIEITAEK